MEQYLRVFLDHHIDAEVLPSLTAEDLKELGVASVGHRRKLLRAIAALRQDQADQQHGAGRSTAPPRAAREAIGAERRQLTLLFCDIADSTAMAELLDPEETRDVIRGYQDRCAEAINRFDGFVAKFIGDGVLAYFGYPHAHEDNAERAVRAGLGIVRSVGQLAPVAGKPVQVRIGIATGIVVVGDIIGEGASEERAVSGGAPNLAARLETVAEPGMVVISDATRRLLGDLFELEDLGTHHLKGIAEPVPAWRVLRERALESRFEASRAKSLTPFVGRQQEVGHLLAKWELAKAGAGQLVLLAGEAGIGKSRLAQMLRERIAQDRHVRLRYQCSPHYSNTALHPVIGQLERAAGFAFDDSPEAKLDKLESLLAESGCAVDRHAPLFADLLSIPASDRYPALDMPPPQRKEATLKALVQQLSGLAERQPVLLVFEDAHWIDPTTQELLDLIIAQLSGSPVLMVMTFRPEYAPPWQGTHVSRLELDRLGSELSAAMIEQVSHGKGLPAEIVEQIVRKTDGVPLFVEELTKTVVESGLLRDEGDRYALRGSLPSIAIPTTLQDSLMARLDRLAPVREVAQIGAALGREFSYQLLAAVSGLDQGRLQDGLDQLVSAELIFQQGMPPRATYMFKHALVQDAAYESLLRSVRQPLHARIARTLEERFPETAETEPELVGHHYTAAGLHEQAASYWLKAGQLAIRRSAPKEAAAHLSKGVEVSGLMPEGPARDRAEAELQSALGPALMVTRGPGHPEVGQAYQRARELCHRLGTSPHLFPVSFGLTLFHWGRGQLEQARQGAIELEQLANAAPDEGQRFAAHTLLGITLWHLGDNQAAKANLERVVAAYRPERHADLFFVYLLDFGVFCRFYLALAYTTLGFLERAARLAADALALARKLNHPHAYGFGLLANFITATMRREPDAVLTFADECIPFSGEHGFPEFVALAQICRGWALTRLGRAPEGVAELEQGIAGWQATGFGSWQSWYGALLAEACLAAGRADDARAAIERQLGRIEDNGERQFESLLLLVKGDATCDQDQAVAEALYAQALATAQRQDALAWQLRAALRLAQLWRTHGDAGRGRALIAPIRARFSEGFATPDLRAADDLLGEAG